MSPTKRIFIIGLPGAGKGLFAKHLAEQLGWEFIDADFGIEYQIGRTLKEIFGAEAQKDFYQCQKEIVTALQAKENVVVATDASIVCDEELRHLLSREFVIFLQVSTAVQIGRNSRNPTPLLATDLPTFFETLHSERDRLFQNSASLTIDTNDNALEEHVSEALEHFKTDQPKSIVLKEKDIVLFHKLSHSPVRLSEQQAVCLRLLAQGKSSKEIAKDMDISYRTVDGTLAKTMELLGCSSSKELIVLYHEKP
ncbi:LuxR C-terminal-related transcriptional regulator [Fluoribacter dumoffii]|uniref:shikimate kinase n=1 Tax=Fluoribacter dumoffii TaxID=463 RepID=UPI0022445F74|nr:shikimate kinase [Fluoribacter dumoffii]MCW8386260.1 LuxR C-terminal-related transcriptional regulator [Fluoribacter dumoffii]MCW8498467.1 LuxR C-terminal-related transcriptional regulator [Fluoribacter dumoffii]